MNYFNDYNKKIEISSQNESILSLFKSPKLLAIYLLKRLRKKELIILILLFFIIFSIGCILYLPDNKIDRNISKSRFHLIGKLGINQSNRTYNDDKILFKNQYKIINKTNSQNIDKIQLITIHTGEDPDPEIRHRRDVVRVMTQHAWNSYVKYAWGENELNPITKTGHSSGIFGKSNVGVTIIDALDTLWIQGLQDEYKKAREYVANELDFNLINSEISVFEFNIRFVGGLLSAYALTKDKLYFKRAKEIANKLLPAFNTPTGIPFAIINPASGHAKNYNWASSSSSILSELGTMHLEFVYLSYLTGRSIYKDKVDKIRNHLDKIKKKDGIYYNFLDPYSGEWSDHQVNIGSYGDSFYEYLLKSWLQTNKQDKQARRMYIESIEAILKKLARTTKIGDLFYFGQLRNGHFVSEMEHLACFSGGMIALGGSKLYSNGDTDIDKYISIGSNITNTCHESYTRTKTRLGPDIFIINENNGKITSSSNQRFYILRPEVIESYFYLWRITKDPKYREWAWEAAQAIQKHCRMESGFVGILNVYSDKSPKDNVQQSFFFAETLKYLYLIFSDDSLINFDDWVFNSEGHSLPILKDWK